MKNLILITFAISSLLAMASPDKVATGVSNDPNALRPSLNSAFDDSENSAGGTGRNCESGNVNCKSGRTLACSATIGHRTHASLCTQHTGSIGWVRCQTFDANGYTTSSFYDECP